MKFWVCLLTLLLTGCASQPASEWSEQSLAEVSGEVVWSAQPAGAVTVSTLFDLVPDDTVIELVGHAMSNNPGVQQQVLTLMSARVQKRVTNSARLPQLSTGFSASRQQDTDTSYNASVDVGWELDLWGKIGDNVEAAQWEIASSEADLLAVQNELAAQVMRTYLQLVTNQQLLAIEQSRLELLTNSQTVILQRYQNGFGSLDDLDSARTNAASAKASVAELTETLAESKRALALLLGQPVFNQLEEDLNTDFPAVLVPLTGLPQQDLAQRPDLISAYANIKSYEARERVAYKTLLPSISLSAGLSDSGVTPSQALFADPVWGLLGQITAPLFQGGQLRANHEAAQIDTLSSYWAYQQTLLDAVKEVEDALGQERSLEAQQQAIQEALVNAKRSAENYTRKYRQGLADVLDVLGLVEQNFDLQSQLIQLQFNQLSNRIDLGLALGLGVSA